MPEAEKVAALREALPSVSAGLYLDTPRAGPLPAESDAAMAEIAGWELRTGRAHRDRHEDVAARVDEARAALAAILTADLDDVGLAHGPGDALARALRPSRLRAGDRVAVVADPELAALPLALPDGVEVVEVGAEWQVPEGAAVVVSPVVRSTSGERLPVELLASQARAGGARFVVEASMALGAMPVTVAGLGADALVARVDAWLLGPQGIAVVAGRGVDGAADGLHLPSVVGVARAAGWLSMYVGLPWIHDRIVRLSGAAAERLGAIHGIELVAEVSRTPIVAFRIAGWPADRALDELGRRIFLLASAVPELDAIRLGVGAWTTEDELERLAGGVEELAAHTPESLPRRPSLTILGQG